jgi:hypothetical protein
MIKTVTETWVETSDVKAHRLHHSGDEFLKVTWKAVKVRVFRDDASGKVFAANEKMEAGAMAMRVVGYELPSFEDGRFTPAKLIYLKNGEKRKLAIKDSTECRLLIAAAAKGVELMSFDDSDEYDVYIDPGVGQIVEGRWVYKHANTTADTTAHKFA